MVADVASLEPASPLSAPALIAPAAREVSYGRVAGTAAPGTRRVIVYVNGKVRASRPVRGRRFSFTVTLPRRDARVRVTAVGADGALASTTVAPVYGLPPSAAPRSLRGFEDPRLRDVARKLAGSYSGVAAIYVEDLRTGAGAAWNAGARFPAASTLKLAIAVEVMRVLEGKPTPDSQLANLLWQLLVYSDNAAANALEVWLGGSTSGGSTRVEATMRRIGMNNSLMYGGYELQAEGGLRPIPVRIEIEPDFGVGKYTTAGDLARLMRLLHLGAGGRGALVRALPGFTPSDARFILYLLAHSTEAAGLGRVVGTVSGVGVLNKAGWISNARHDAGLVFWPTGGFVAAVMTWNPRGAGQSSDELAGRLASRALERFRELRRSGAYHEPRGNRI